MLAPALVLLLALPTADNPPSKLPTPPDGYRWEANAQLSDEFDGAKLDTTKWQPRQPYWKGREPSRFEEGNVLVRDGLLLLRSTALVDDLSGVKDPKKDIWIGAACMASLTPCAGPGYYEAHEGIRPERVVLVLVPGEIFRDRRGRGVRLAHDPT